MTAAPFLSDPRLGRIWNELPEARLVGGAVRDALANRPVSDFDLATPTPPQTVMTRLQRAGIKVVPTGLAHGTVTAVVEGHPFEITTLRRDVETDGRRAVVAFTDDWRLDASRRDFTINAMSMDRAGTVFDDFGGQADLAAGRIRFVGDPAMRIAEDYLRILRFFRFHARYGRLPPDEATLQAVRDGIPGLARLSKERIWNELRRILAAPDPAEAIALMRTLGIWQAVIPEAAGAAPLADLPADPVLRLAAILTGDPLALAARLKLSNDDRDRLVRLATVPHPGGTDADLRRLMADHLPQDLKDRALLDGKGDVHARLSSLTRPVFPLEGRDVVAQGVPAGPAVGALLRDLRQWWMDGGCVASRMACMTELARRAELTNMGGKR